MFDEIDQLQTVQDSNVEQLKVTRSILVQCSSAASCSRKRNEYEISAIEVAAKNLFRLLTKS